MEILLTIIYKVLSKNASKLSTSLSNFGDGSSAQEKVEKVETLWIVSVIEEIVSRTKVSGMIAEPLESLLSTVHCRSGDGVSSVKLGVLEMQCLLEDFPDLLMSKNINSFQASPAWFSSTVDL